MDYVDEFPEVAVGDLVQAVGDVSEADSDDLAAEQGDLGRVVSKGEWSAPTIEWERTGAVADAVPSQFRILCAEGFASTPETTPTAPVRGFLKRLASTWFAVPARRVVSA